jgi:hypothetical protein
VTSPSTPSCQFCLGLPGPSDPGCPACGRSARDRRALVADLRAKIDAANKLEHDEPGYLDWTPPLRARALLWQEVARAANELANRHAGDSVATVAAPFDALAAYDAWAWELLEELRRNGHGDLLVDDQLGMRMGARRRINELVRILERRQGRAEAPEMEE